MIFACVGIANPSSFVSWFRRTYNPHPFVNEVIPTAFSHIRGFAQMDAYKRNFCHCRDSLHELNAKIQNFHDNMKMNTLGMNGIFTTPRLCRRCRHHRKGTSRSRLQDGIGAVGAVFEQEFLGLGEFFRTCPYGRRYGPGRLMGTGWQG